jgi:hypothetical protein
MSTLCTLSNIFGREVCKDLNDHTGGWFAEANFAIVHKQLGFQKVYCILLPETAKRVEQVNTNEGVLTVLDTLL